MFKWRITLDRHGPTLLPNICALPEHPYFSFPTTFIIVLLSFSSESKSQYFGQHIRKKHTVPCITVYLYIWLEWINPDPDRQALDADTDPTKLCRFDRIQIHNTAINGSRKEVGIIVYNTVMVGTPLMLACSG
jgi:hypothetical protein